MTDLAEPRDAVDMKAGLDLLDDIAARRREAAQKDAERAQPDFLVSIETSQVVYTMSPKALPLGQAEFGELSSYLMSAYSLGLLSPDLGPLLREHSAAEVSELPPEDAMRELFRLSLDQNQSLPRLEFTVGRFPVSKRDYVEVNSVRYNRESISVMVAGPSRIAEVIAQECMEYLWRSTGVEKRWEDIQPLVELVGYGTTTKVDLGFNFAGLLHPTLLEFVDQSIIGGKQIAAHMGDYSKRYGFGPNPNANLMYALSRLEIDFTRFDMKTGRSTATSLRLYTSNAEEPNSGLVNVWSELPFELHMACLGELRSLMLPMLGNEHPKG